MTDVLTKEQRSRCMASIKSKNTKPELAIRRLVRRMGFRFRLNVAHLPGKPDMVFPSRNKLIFVHGCFFHKHRCRYGNVVPKTNRSFWDNKRRSNAMRDKKVVGELKKLGWDVLVIWECWIKKGYHLEEMISRFMLSKTNLAKNTGVNKNHKGGEI